MRVNPIFRSSHIVSLHPIGKLDITCYPGSMSPSKLKETVQHGITEVSLNKFTKTILELPNLMMKVLPPHESLIFIQVK